jgi:ankyrin repeat protein
MNTTKLTLKNTFLTGQPLHEKKITPKKVQRANRMYRFPSMRPPLAQIDGSGKEDIPSKTLAPFSQISQEVATPSTNLAQVPKSTHKEVLQKADQALKTKNISLLRQLLQEGLPPDTKDARGETLLHLAIKQNCPSMVDLLLNHGADPNSTTPDKYEFSFIDITCNTIKKHEVVDLSPLLSSLCLSNVAKEKNLKNTHDITSLLLQRGADVNYREPTHGFTAAHFACRIADPVILQRLIHFHADLNQIAYFDSHDEHDELFHNVTPLFILTNNMADARIHQENNCLCVKKILQNGGNPELNCNNKDDLIKMLFVVSLTLPDMAEKIMRSQIQKDFSRLNKSRIDSIVDAFIKEGPVSECILNQYSDSILNTYTDKVNAQNHAIYFTHLNSWVNQVSTKDADQYSMTHSEGWLHEIHIPKKIKNLLMTLRSLHNGNIDCKENFGETKSQILKKLKDEIWHQASTYFTVKHGYAVSKIMQTFRATPAQIRLASNIFKKEVFAWCTQINQLNLGEKFSVGAGNSEHAIYMDFEKQKDGNITYRLFNLGGGNILHPVSMENRVYPYVIRDIPGKRFKSYHPSALETLGHLILETGNRHDDASLVQNIYVKFYQSMGGKPLNSIDGLVPMKYQVAGNCTVKNNNFAMANRLLNKKLYQYVKKIEIERIKESIDISSRLFKNKELQKDVQNLKLMLMFKENSPMALEGELFEFLKKRARILDSAVMNQKGNRLAEAILKLNDPNALDTYLTQVPELINAVHQIANYYQSDKLKKCFSENFHDFSIHQKKALGKPFSFL